MIRAKEVSFGDSNLKEIFGGFHLRITPEYMAEANREYETRMRHQNRREHSRKILNIKLDQYDLKVRQYQKELESLMFFYLSLKAFLNNKETIMDAKILMGEIKSKALKQIAESLNDILEKTKAEEIDIKQALLQITAHKHLIQTIALDWTFNGVKDKIKALSYDKS